MLAPVLASFVSPQPLLAQVPVELAGQPLIDRHGAAAGAGLRWTERQLPLHLDRLLLDPQHLVCQVDVDSPQADGLTPPQTPQPEHRVEQVQRVLADFVKERREILRCPHPWTRRPVDRQLHSRAGVPLDQSPTYRRVECAENGRVDPAQRRRPDRSDPHLATYLCVHLLEVGGGQVGQSDVPHGGHDVELQVRLVRLPGRRAQ